MRLGRILIWWDDSDWNCWRERTDDGRVFMKIGPFALFIRAQENK